MKKSQRTISSPNAKLISYYLPRRRFSADVVAPLGQVLAEINNQQNVKDNTTEEGQEMSTEDFAQLSREEQLKVNGFKSKTKPKSIFQQTMNS